jgi:hypothetical protein
MAKDSTGQYVVENADGTPVEPGAQFLVLRLDGEGRDADRWGAQAYAVFAEGNIGRAVANVLNAIRERTSEPGFRVARKVTYARNESL